MYKRKQVIHNTSKTGPSKLNDFYLLFMPLSAVEVLLQAAYGSNTVKQYSATSVIIENLVSHA
jgi:hypothetical protein